MHKENMLIRLTFFKYLFLKYVYICVCVCTDKRKDYRDIRKHTLKTLKKPN